MTRKGTIIETGVVFQDAKALRRGYQFIGLLDKFFYIFFNFTITDKSFFFAKIDLLPSK